jgi:hypothetical protein
MRTRVIVSLALGAVACAGGILVACDLEVDTNYGPHSGLQKSNLPNPPAPDAAPVGDGGAPCGMPVEAGACSVSYSKDIWTKMSSTWGCSNAACHGAMVNQPYNLDNQQDAYNNLTQFQIGGLYYFNPCSTNPDASAFVCNTSSPACGTGQMPFPNTSLMTGPLSTSDMQLVQTWVACGAPNN